MNDDQSELNRNDVRRRFDSAAAQFDSVDFVHTTTRNGLLDRLAPMLIEPRTILDLGAATGTATRLLARRYRRARIIAIDLSRNMLEQTRKKQAWFSRTSIVQADATALPLADHSVDFVFANLLLPWVGSPAATFSEVSRVLVKDGLFAFTTLGPDSLSEIRAAWRSLDSGAHVNQFPDMHNIGDAAVQAGLRDPVLDVDRLIVTYKDAGSLFRDLTAMGGRNSLSQRDRSLASAKRFEAMTAALDGLREKSLLTLELELLFGHCWGSGPRSVDGEIRVAAGAIGRREQKSSSL
jgi:malonyl-CoA O-methyltransferase